jgi:hypothetical protein
MPDLADIDPEPVPIEDVIRKAALSYERHNGHPPSTFAISRAVLDYYGRARVKAVAAAMNIDLTDHDGLPL